MQFSLLFYDYDYDSLRPTEVSILDTPLSASVTATGSSTGCTLHAHACQCLCIRLLFQLPREWARLCNRTLTKRRPALPCRAVPCPAVPCPALPCPAQRGSAARSPSSDPNATRDLRCRGMNRMRSNVIRWRGSSSGSNATGRQKADTSCCLSRVLFPDPAVRPSRQVPLLFLSFLFPEQSRQ